MILDACRKQTRSRARCEARSGRTCGPVGWRRWRQARARWWRMRRRRGDVAEDGEGRHSPFTEALLAGIEQPGVEVRIMLGNVGEAVRVRTGRQQPFVYSSLSGEHFLGNVAAAGPSPASVEASTGAWTRRLVGAVQRGLSAAGFAAGLPDGVFGPTTRAAIRAWQRSRGATPNGYLDAGRPAAALGAPPASPARPSPAVTGAPAAASTATAAALSAGGRRSGSRSRTARTRRTSRRIWSCSRTGRSLGWRGTGWRRSAGAAMRRGPKVPRWLAARRRRRRPVQHDQLTRARRYFPLVDVSVAPLTDAETRRSGRFPGNGRSKDHRGCHFGATSTPR